jgi:hypothetical protein
MPKAPLLALALALALPVLPGCADTPSRASCDQAIERMGELFHGDPGARTKFVDGLMTNVDTCTSGQDGEDKVACVAGARSRAAVLACLGEPAEEGP